MSFYSNYMPANKLIAYQISWQVHICVHPPYSAFYHGPNNKHLTENKKRMFQVHAPLLWLQDYTGIRNLLTCKWPNPPIRRQKAEYCNPYIGPGIGVAEIYIGMDY